MAYANDSRTTGRPVSNATDWLDRALNGNPVMNIGQIDKATARLLDKCVKAGELVKVRASWMNLSPWKTVWCLPENVVNVGSSDHPTLALLDGGKIFAMKQ